MMTDNKLKEPVIKEEKKVEAPKKRSQSNFSRSLIRFMNVFGIFNRNQIVHSMPFILFITILIIGYIANSYYAEKIIRDIDKTKTELKENRAEYISIMSRLMYQSNQSQVAKVLEPYQIKENTESPSKIFITEVPAQ
jgi:hypothetical protein